MIDWVPVEEKLPEENVLVLLFVDCPYTERVPEVGYLSEEGFFNGDVSSYGSDEISHWAAINEPEEKYE